MSAAFAGDFEARQAVGHQGQGHHQGKGEEGLYAPSWRRAAATGTTAGGLPALCGLHGGDEGRLVLRATARLATGALATQVGIFDFPPARVLAGNLA